MVLAACGGRGQDRWDRVCAAYAWPGKGGVSEDGACAEGGEGLGFGSWEGQGRVYWCLNAGLAVRVHSEIYILDLLVDV